MMKLLDYLVHRIEMDRPVCPVIGTTAIAESGDKFIAFSTGPHDEGDYLTPYGTAFAACEAFLMGFEKWAEGKDGWALYWRHKPEFIYDDGKRLGYKGEKYPDEPPSWRVYARLVLSPVRDAHE